MQSNIKINNLFRNLKENPNFSYLELLLFLTRRKPLVEMSTTIPTQNKEMRARGDGNKALYKTPN